MSGTQTLRTYTKVPLGTSGYQWVEVTTDANGYNDAVYLATLCQVLLLDRGESPFYGNYGVPSLEALQTQVPPDLYVAQTQAQFAPFFAALTVTRATALDGSPIYNIRVVTHSGAILTAIAGQAGTSLSFVLGTSTLGGPATLT